MQNTSYIQGYTDQPPLEKEAAAVTAAVIGTLFKLFIAYQSIKEGARAVKYTGRAIGSASRGEGKKAAGEAGLAALNALFSVGGAYFVGAPLLRPLARGTKTIGELGMGTALKNAGRRIVASKAYKAKLALPADAGFLGKAKHYMFKKPWEYAKQMGHAADYPIRVATGKTMSEAGRFAGKLGGNSETVKSLANSVRKPLGRSYVNLRRSPISKRINGSTYAIGDTVGRFYVENPLEDYVKKNTPFNPVSMFASSKDWDRAHPHRIPGKDKAIQRARETYQDFKRHNLPRIRQAINQSMTRGIDNVSNMYKNRRNPPNIDPNFNRMSDSRSI